MAEVRAVMIRPVSALATRIAGSTAVPSSAWISFAADLTAEPGAAILTGLPTAIAAVRPMRPRLRTL